MESVDENNDNAMVYGKMLKHLVTYLMCVVQVLGSSAVFGWEIIQTSKINAVIYQVSFKNKTSTWVFVTD